MKKTCKFIIKSTIKKLNQQLIPQKISIPKKESNIRKQKKIILIIKAAGYYLTISPKQYYPIHKNIVNINKYPEY